MQAGKTPPLYRSRSLRRVHMSREQRRQPRRVTSRHAAFCGHTIDFCVASRGSERAASPATSSWWISPK
jgi:hypothetical protein